MAKSKVPDLDMGDFPDLNCASILIETAAMIKAKSDFPLFAERIINSVRYCSMSMAERDNGLRAGHIRSGLCELISSEAPLAKEYGIDFKLKMSRSPIVHIAYILRCASEHHFSMATEIRNIQICWGEFVFKEWPACVMSITLEDFVRCSSSRKGPKYTDLQTKKMYEYLLKRQEAFGLNFVIADAANKFCVEVMNKTTGP